MRPEFQPTAPREFTKVQPLPLEVSKGTHPEILRAAGAGCTECGPQTSSNSIWKLIKKQILRAHPNRAESALQWERGTNLPDKFSKRFFCTFNCEKHPSWEVFGSILAAVGEVSPAGLYKCSKGVAGGQGEESGPPGPLWNRQRVFRMMPSIQQECINFDL